MNRVARVGLIVVGVGGVAVSLALRWPGMTRSIWFDECCRTFVLLNRETLIARLFHDAHNPLYNAFMYPWISVLGDSEVSIRLPSLLAGYASLAVLCWWIARRLGAVGSPEQTAGAPDASTRARDRAEAAATSGGRAPINGRDLAWCVAAWMLVSPVHVWYSTEAKNTMFVLAFAILIPVCYDWLVRRCASHAEKGAVPLLAAIAAGTCSIATNFLGVLVLAPVWAWSIRQARCGGRRSVSRVVIAIAATLGLCAPLVLFKAAHTHELWRDYLTPFRVRECVELLGSEFLCGNAIVLQEVSRTAPALVGFAVAAPLLVLGAVRLRRQARGRMVVSWFIAGLAGMALASLVIDATTAGHDKFIYQPRNLLIIFPAYATMLMAGALSLPRRWMRRGVAGGLIGVNLVASVLMITVYRDDKTVLMRNIDWREATRLIEADAERAVGGAGAGAGGASVNGVTIVACSRSPVHCLKYYRAGVTGDGQAVVVSTWGGELDLPAFRAVVAKYPGAVAYYIDDRAWFPLSEAQVNELTRDGGFVRVLAMESLVVYRMSTR